MYVKDNFLMHYGVLGQKWGVRRYQNKDGSLTNEGIAKYRPNRSLGNFSRAMWNGSLGQRVVGVGGNRGYKRDQKEIRKEYKRIKREYKKTIADRSERSDAIKSLKSDYKKTLGEARVSAATALYPWQSKTTNEKIQTQHAGKQYVKALLMTDYGALNYDRLRSSGKDRTTSATLGVLSGMADSLVYGWGSVGDHIVNRANYKANSKKK